MHRLDVDGEMRKILCTAALIFAALVALLVVVSPALAVTCTGTSCTFTTGDTQTTQQTYLNSTSYQSYTWSAGTYKYTAGLKIRCNGAQAYSGAALSGGQPTTIFDATYTGSYLLDLSAVSSSFTAPGQGCTVSGIEFQNQQIQIATGASGVLIEHVKIDGITYANNSGFLSMAIYANGSSVNNGGGTSNPNTPGTNSCANGWCYSTVEWSTFSNLCQDVAGTDTSGDGYGVCGSVGWHGSDSNITIANNTWSNGYEGIKAIAANPFGSSYQYSTDLTINNNDMGGMHRIGIELQSDVCVGRTVYGNDYHDDVNPDGNTMFISDAGCAPAAGSSSPSEVHHDNTGVANVSGNPSCGFPGGYCSPEYAEETWGNGPYVHNDLIQGYWEHGIVIGSLQQSTGVSCNSTYFPSGGYPCPSASPNFSYNTVQGPNMSTSGTSAQPMVGCEDAVYNWPTACGQSGTLVTGTYTGDTTNNKSTSVSAAISTAPSISPASGTASFPLTVTITNSASNQGAWCTNDGSSPVPGTGTAVRYDPIVGDTMTLSGAATVKCVGMWGQGANTVTWPSGYGWTPSSVVAATYTSSSSGSGFTMQGSPVQLQGSVVLQ